MSRRLVAGGILGFMFLASGCGGTTKTGAPPAAPTSAPTAGLATPEALAFDRKGTLYVTDCEGFRIFRLEDAGRLTLVAGVGGSGYGQYSGDGGPALQAELGCPAQLAFGADGRLYFADHVGNRVRTIDEDGMIETFAGSGPAGLDTGSLAGDGGPATKARMSEPLGVAFDSQGWLYVSDRDNARIRRIDRDGIITTFAGTSFGFRGDGGPARQAKFSEVYDIAFDGQGDLLLADTGNNRLRMIDPHGVITTVAGTGRATSSGDGGPATKASLNGPYGVTVDAAGDIFVSESDGNRVRMIAPNGSISTIAGTGRGGFSGDGGRQPRRSSAVPPDLPSTSRDTCTSPITTTPACESSGTASFERSQAASRPGEPRRRASRAPSS
jgi:sugar lactone lactonase YvrE